MDATDGDHYMTYFTAPDRIPAPDDPNASADAIGVLRGLVDAVQSAFTATRGLIDTQANTLRTLSDLVAAGMNDRYTKAQTLARFPAGVIRSEGWVIPGSYGSWKDLGSVMIGAYPYLLSLSAARAANGIDASAGMTSHAITELADMSSRSGTGTLHLLLRGDQDGDLRLGYKIRFGGTDVVPASTERSVQLGRSWGAMRPTLTFHAVGSV
jgi:hypothetical protein